MANPGELLEFVRKMGPMKGKFGSELEEFTQKMGPMKGTYGSTTPPPAVTATPGAPPTRLPGSPAEIINDPTGNPDVKRNAILKLLAILGIGGGAGVLGADAIKGLASPPASPGVPSFVDQVSNDEASRPRIGERLEDMLAQKKRTGAPGPKRGAAPPPQNPQSALKPTVDRADPTMMSPEELERYFRSGGYRQGVM